MNGRTSVGLLSIALSLGCAGCFTTQNEKSVITSPSGNAGGKIDEAPQVTKRDDGPKRKPQASTEIAFGRLKEAEADAEAAKAHPEMQARLREEARKAYQGALKSDPNHLEAHRCLAGVYARGNDYERAFDIYKKALAKHPNNGGLWYDLGLCHLRRKDMTEAVRCLQKALELEPENRDYMKKLGFTLAYMGQIDQGKALLTRAQGSALAHYNVARVLIQQNHIEQARQFLSIALRENAQLAEARELLNRLENPTPQTTPRGTSD